MGAWGERERCGADPPVHFSTGLPSCHTGESRYPRQAWIPAYAGMTIRVRGMNDGLFHLAFLGVGVGVVGEHHFLHLAHKIAVAVLGDP